MNADPNSVFPSVPLRTAESAIDVDDDDIYFCPQCSEEIERAAPRCSHCDSEGL